MQEDSPGLERVVLDPEAFEAQIGETRVVSGLVTCDARSAFVRGEAGEGALRRLAAIHEEVLVASERADAHRERRDLRVEVLDHGAARVLPVSEKDASQGGRDEGVVFLRDDGQVGRDWFSGRREGERGSASVSVSASR